MSDQTPTPEKIRDTPCVCLTAPQYTLDAEDGYEVPEMVYGPCGRTTTREFAPGHDAKLKSLLQALYVSGSEYHRLEGGLLISGDPYSVAASRDWTHFLHSAKGIADRKDEARRQRDLVKARKAIARDEAKLAKALKAKDDQHGAPDEDADDAMVQAARAEVERQIAAEDAAERNVQVGDQVRITVRGREVDGEVVKVDATVARVRYLTTKGEESVAVKPLRDLR